MKSHIIKRKMSGTGSIHGLASDLYDREIKFRKGTKYAVVLSSYYGNLYTTHKTAKAAAQKSLRVKQSHVIIDSDGNHYNIYGDDLIEVE